MRKRLIIAGVIVICIAAFIYWGTGFIYDVARARSADEREVLAAQIEKTQKELENRPQIDDTLQYQLEELQAQLEYESTELPDDIYIPGFIDTMLTIAEENAITIVPLRTTDWSSTSSGFEEYQVQVLVAGEIDAIENFITTLENGDIGSVVTAGLQLNGDGIGDKEEPSQAEGALIVSMYRR